MTQWKHVLDCVQSVVYQMKHIVITSNTLAALTVNVVTSNPLLFSLSTCPVHKAPPLYPLCELVARCQVCRYAGNIPGNMLEMDTGCCVVMFFRKVYSLEEVRKFSEPCFQVLMNECEWMNARSHYITAYPQLPGLVVDGRQVHTPSGTLALSHRLSERRYPSLHLSDSLFQ